MLSRGSSATALTLLAMSLFGLDSGAAEARSLTGSTVITEEAAPFDPLCDAAEALAEEDPQAALEIIEAVRGGAPTDAPISRERRAACADQLDAALGSAVLMQLGDDDYCDLLENLEAAEAVGPALALEEKRESSPDCAANEWILTEQQEAEAENGGWPPSTKDTETAWEEFVESALEPLTGIAAFLLASWGAMLVLSRLLVFFPFRDPLTSRDDRLGMAFAGFLAILLGPVIFVAGVDSGQLVGVIVGSILAVIGALLVGRWLASLPKLALEVDGKDDTGVEEGLLSAVLRDMGGEAGRGLEIPIGPDMTALEASVSELSKNDWIAVAQKVVLFITNIKPWRVQVHMVSSEIAIARIGRNGREVASQRIAASDARVTEEADEAGCGDAQRIAAQVAAFVIATMLPKYPADFKPGLYGATKADSIALQYVASAWYSKKADNEQAIELLRRATTADPANRSAELSHWKFRYRFATAEADLLAYGKFLKDRIQKLKDNGEIEQYDRSVIAYLAVWRNWTAVKAAASETDQDRWWTLDKKLEQDEFRPEPDWVNDVINSGSASHLFGPRGSIDSKKRAAVAKIDKALLDQTLSTWDTAERIPPGVRSMLESPYVAYSLACAITRLGLRNDVQRQNLEWSARDSELKIWARSKDPELQRVRVIAAATTDDDWFTEILGREPETELQWAPFEQYREALDVTTRAELIETEWSPTLGVDLVLFLRLRAAAELSRRAEALDQLLGEAGSRQARRLKALGRDARMIAVRHLFERKTDPLCDHVEVDIDPLLRRLRDAGYCGTHDDLDAWIAQLRRTTFSHEERAGRSDQNRNTVLEAVERLLLGLGSPDAFLETLSRLGFIENSKSEDDDSGRTS